MKLLNPYLDLFEGLSSCHSPCDHKILDAIRRKVIWAYSWAIPTEEAIQALRELSPLIEIGAGSGYWAWLLRQVGTKITAFDRNTSAPPHWSEVLEGGAERIPEFPNHTLMLCWPPDRNPLASECLNAYRGRYLVFIGEKKDGVTADPLFYDLLDRDFTLVRTIPLPRWPGCADSLFIFERKAVSAA